MERKIGIIIDDKDVDQALESLKIISEQGFNAFFTMPVSKEYCHKMKERADQLDIEYEFIHATYQGINELWTSESTPKILLDLKDQIELCHEVGVNKLIVHLSSGNDAPMVNDIGFIRLDEIVEFAKSKNVLLVFENQRKLYNISCVLEKYKNGVGYCYDSGHENCFTQNVKFLDFWAEKVKCVHLHDNCGRKDKDEHLLPFDGTVDFDYVMKSLNRVNYSGSIMLEVFNSIYPSLNKREFFKKAYERAKKLTAIK